MISKLSLSAMRLAKPARNLAPARCIHTTHLEVERKFNVAASPRLRSHLNITCDNDPKAESFPRVKIGILHFSRHPDEHINDQYFDTSDFHLDAKGIWVRRRSTSTKDSASVVEWEAKVRVGGDYLNSEFEEITGKEKIKAYLEPLGVIKLHRIVDLDTSRESWVAIEQEVSSESPQPSKLEVKVVVDTSTAGGTTKSLPGLESPFRHVVGELELTKEVALSGDGEKDTKMKKEETRKMSTELEKFMKRHEALFPTKPAPVGKLTAYFAWRKQAEEHFKEQY